MTLLDEIEAELAEIEAMPVVPATHITVHGPRVKRGHRLYDKVAKAKAELDPADRERLRDIVMRLLIVLTEEHLPEGFKEEANGDT